MTWMKGQKPDTKGYPSGRYPRPGTTRKQPKVKVKLDKFWPARMSRTVEASTFLLERGFERLRLGERSVFWRVYKKTNVVIEEATGTSSLPPDFKTRHALMSIYRGQTPRENLIHQETGYEVGDVIEFISDLERGVLCHDP